MWQSLLVYNACLQPQTEATVLVSPSLLQIDTFGNWCRCLHNVCYLKTEKAQISGQIQIICTGWQHWVWVWQSMTVCVSVWQFVTVCDSLWQFLAVCDRVWQSVTECDSVTKCERVWHQQYLQENVIYFTWCSTFFLDTCDTCDILQYYYDKKYRISHKKVVAI